ncbi:uncharacterized protein LOC136081849 isoform X1 [Hydra vulgaris]|uniref:Uncharacterized protein LOC136081849 isoform X1 n=1 Tax=Hydra vulgaris TaxID=6087 RepID=A0ABM4C3R6_HYDVU
MDKIVKSYEKRGSEVSAKQKLVYACERDESQHFKKLFIDNKIGYGIFTKRDFEANEVLLEYKGEVISRVEAKLRHKKYFMEKKGCFIYDVDFGSERVSIDATFSLSFGRFINDSAEKFSNCRPKCCLVEGKYRLMFFSKCFIPLNTELRYDYGDKINQKWRDSRDYLKPLTVNDLRNSLLGKPLKQHLTKVSEVLLCSSSNQLEDVGLKESSLATNLMNQLRQPPAVLFKESEEVLSCKLELEYEPMVSLSDILLVRPTEEKIDESEKKNLMIDIKEIKTMKQKKANSDNVIQESFKISVEECLPTIGIEKTTFMVSNENNGNHHIGLEESPHGSK